MENKHTNNFSLLINLITGVFVLCLLAFSALLIDDRIDGWFKPTPIAKTGYSGAGGSQNNLDEDRVVNGIHVQTGLAYAEGFDIVRGTCTACHSAKLVTQNRATRAGWEQMIRWMQATQGLWELGKNEPIILDYLAKHYAPEETGRRANLDLADVEWFILELE
ncbi:MAG: hypothetical protein AB8G22_26785 [Saprospiraceae bacterium]